MPHKRHFKQVTKLGYTNDITKHLQDYAKNDIKK